jgi:hypothetical protein
MSAETRPGDREKRVSFCMMSKGYPGRMTAKWDGRKRVYPDRKVNSPEAIVSGVFLLEWFQELAESV